jgi:biotin carboxylase
MKKKRVLLVDTNRAAVPIYKSLIAQGFHVTVVGGDPQETLAKMAENYKELDYSNVSALKKYIDESGFEYIVPGCTDLSYEVCAKIGEGQFLGVDSEENTDLINNKNKFRLLCEELLIPVPKILNLTQAINTPFIIVKPVDSFSGRGIEILEGANELAVNDAFEYACSVSKTKTALVEEYVKGQLFSYSVFIKNQKVAVEFFVQEDATTTPFTVDTSRVIESVGQNIHEKIKVDIERLANKLNLVDGLVHTQLIVQDDKYWIIEMTRRCPGDIYSMLIQYSTYYDYAANYAATFTGEKISPFKRGEINQRVIRHTITSEQGERFWGLQFMQPVEIKLFVPLATSGDYIKPSPYGRVGVLFLTTQSIAEQELTYQKLLNRNLYTLGFQNKELK